MNLSAEEKLMYAVMNAIYSSGIPILPVCLQFLS